MKPRFRFALGAYLLLEIWATLEVAAWLGDARTMLLLILGVAAGIAVLRREKLAVLSQLRHPDTLPGAFTPSLPDRALRAVAGLLLIVPGFISDAAALVLLVPQSRHWVIRRWSARGFDRSPTGLTIIEGEFHRVDDPMLTQKKHEPRSSRSGS